MKKFISIVCLSLVCLFGFAGCSAQKNVDKLLDAQQSFITTYSDSFLIEDNKEIFTEALEADYNRTGCGGELTLRQLEKLLQTSNLTFSRLKIHLENKENVKKIKDSDVKALIKLENDYYSKFGSLISTVKSLQTVLDKGSQNTKSDYENLNTQIKNTLVASCTASKKLTDIFKNVYNIKFDDKATNLSSGELEILVLQTASDLVYFYSKIYIEETSMEMFGNLSANLNLDDVLITIAKTASSKFDLSDANYTNLKANIEFLMNYNDVLASKLDLFDKTISTFDYETLKRNAKSAYPNETSISTSIVNYVNGNKIDITTQQQYNFLADIIANNIKPAATNLKVIVDKVASL